MLPFAMCPPSTRCYLRAPAPVVEYEAAPNVACQPHAAPAPEVTPAPDVAYREHAASAPEVTPAPDVAYRAHAAAAPVRDHTSADYGVSGT